MKKILALVLAMVLLCSGILSVSAEVYYNIEDMPESERHMVELIESKYSSSYPFSNDYCEFKQVYSYYADGASSDEATADYILFRLHCAPYIEPMCGVEYIGEYAVYHGNYYSPYRLGYFVYVPERDEVYTLKDAYYADIDGIEKAFTEGCYLSALTGDVNVDGKLNIKDATFIQKQLADLLPEHPLDIIEKLDNGNSYFYDYMRDFNQDEEINIKDATAIQKYLAGITE